MISLLFNRHPKIASSTSTIPVSWTVTALVQDRSLAKTFRQCVAADPQVLLERKRTGTIPWPQ